MAKESKYLTAFRYGMRNGSSEQRKQAMTNRQLQAQRYMDKYRDAIRRVRQCEEQLERERVSVDAIRSPSDNDGMPHGNGISRPTEDKAIRLSEKSLNLFDEQLKAMRIQREVFEIAYSIGGVESDILIERYINLKNWNDVYKAVNYARTQVHRYHKIGLDKVADILGI